MAMDHSIERILDWLSLIWTSYIAVNHLISDWISDWLS
jgi:hypothetical protein